MELNEIRTYGEEKLTFSTPVKSLSKSSNELIEMPDLLCQFMPYSDAAILDAAVVLAEYIEKLCSVNWKCREKKLNELKMHC